MSDLTQAQRIALAEAEGKEIVRPNSDSENHIPSECIALSSYTTLDEIARVEEKFREKGWYFTMESSTSMYDHFIVKWFNLSGTLVKRVAVRHELPARTTALLELIAAKKEGK